MLRAVVVTAILAGSASNYAVSARETPVSGYPVEVSVDDCASWQAVGIGTAGNFDGELVMYYLGDEPWYGVVDGDKLLRVAEDALTPEELEFVWADYGEGDTYRIAWDSSGEFTSLAEAP